MKLVVNETEAKAVQMIFAMYLDGESYSSIIRALNQGGYKTKFGKTFGNNSLYSILHNEKYTGVYIYSKSAPKDVDGKRNGHKYKSDDEIIRIEGGIPALISKDDFERVQEKLSKRRRCGSAPRAKQTYLLSGKVICGQCNHVYVGNCRPERPDHPEYITYRCNNRNKRPRCDGWEIKREILESMVLGELARLVFNDFMIPKLVSAYEQYQNSFSSEELRDQKRIKKHIAETQGNIDNLVAVVMKTASDTLVAKINELEEEKRGYERQLHELGRKNEKRSMTEEELQHSFHQAREMLKEGKLSTVKKLIERYIQKVIVNGRKIEIQFDLNVGGDSPRQRQGVKKETLPSPVEDESMFPLISQPMLVRFGGEGGI